MKRGTKIRLAAWGCLLAGLVIVLKFVLLISVVVGESMSPALKPWDFCVLRRTSAYPPQRGDIVMFRTADDPPLYLIKRVIALPGETIQITRGIVHLNDQPLPEPYTTPNTDWTLPAMTIPPGKVYVIGDNRRHDGETWHGLVATRLVKGRLLWRGRWKT